jgi:hypothetical protein
LLKNSIDMLVRAGFEKSKAGGFLPIMPLFHRGKIHGRSSTASPPHAHQT